MNCRIALLQGNPRHCLRNKGRCRSWRSVYRIRNLSGVFFASFGLIMFDDGNRSSIPFRMPRLRFCTATLELFHAKICRQDGSLFLSVTEILNVKRMVFKIIPSCNGLLKKKDLCFLSIQYVIPLAKHLCASAFTTCRRIGLG